MTHSNVVPPYIILTLLTAGVSSKTFRDAFRIGWVADHKAFVSFFGANIMADNIQIVIAVKISSKASFNRKATGNELETQAEPFLKRPWYLRAIGVDSLVGSRGQDQFYEK